MFLNVEFLEGNMKNDYFTMMKLWAFSIKNF